MVRLNKTQTFRNENIFFAFGLIWPFVSHNTTGRAELSTVTFQLWFCVVQRYFSGASKVLYLDVQKKLASRWVYLTSFTQGPNTRFITLPGLLKSKFVTPVRCVAVSFLLFALFLTIF